MKTTDIYIAPFFKQKKKTQGHIGFREVQHPPSAEQGPAGPSVYI